MVKRINWIKYKTKDILYVDFSELKNSDEIIELINQAEKEIHESKHDNILYLINIQNSSGSPKVIDEYKKFSKNTKNFIYKDAVIGASSIQNILLNAIKSFAGITLKNFNTIEEAKEYLIK